MGGVQSPPNFEIMDIIDVYESDNIQLDPSELEITELPPVPEWFSNSINELAGFCDEKPNIRVISGLHADAVEWIGGKWWRKYAIRVFDTKEYVEWHKPNKDIKILSFKEAEIISSSKNFSGILIPKRESIVKEIPIPRYFVEIYRPPEWFGSKTEWEKYRYMFDEELGKVDIMGEFPENGLYETWFCIDEPVFDSSGKLIKTKFRNLDETVLAFIKAKIQEVLDSGNSMARQVEKIVSISEEQKQKNLALIKENIGYRVKDRINRLTNTPRSVVPRNYDRNKSKKTSTK